MAKSKSSREVADGNHASTHVGKSVAFEVRGGGGTGFAWEPTEPLPLGVKIEKEYNVASPKAGIGGMSRETLKFSFSKPGVYEINLGFASPGRGEIAEEKKFKFNVK